MAFAPSLSTLAERPLQPRLDVVLVCGVHLKSGGGDQTLGEVRHLGSKAFQQWLDVLMDEASAKARQLPHLNLNSNVAAAEGGPSSVRLSTCELLIGDFNLSGPAPSYDVGGTSKVLRPAWQNPGGQGTQPGDAWEGALNMGFRLLLPPDTCTNLGPPITKQSVQYDNALARFSYGCESCSADSDEGRNIAEGGRRSCGACTAAMDAAARSSAFACSTMAADEFQDARQTFDLLGQRRPPETAIVTEALDRLRKDIKRQIFGRYSDHFPICAWL